MARAMKLTVDRGGVDAGERRPHEPAGYIELGVLGNKGARRDTHRRMLLPVVAPMLTLSQSPWWDSWLEARMALQLDTDMNLTTLCCADLIAMGWRRGTAWEHLKLVLSYGLS